jgi:hypothetical protein
MENRIYGTVDRSIGLPLTGFNALKERNMVRNSSATKGMSFLKHSSHNALLSWRAELLIVKDVNYPITYVLSSLLRLMTEVQRT